jgi:hypothetical protein
MKVRIAVQPSFDGALKRLPPDRAKAATQSLVKFMAEPALPRLRFRPLEGKSGYYIIDAKRGDRIILRKEADDLYSAVDVGPHDHVYRRWNR